MANREMAGGVSGTQGRAEDRYFELVRTFPLRPIRSDEELDRATEMVDSLVIRGHLDPGEQDYLDVLAELAEKYEMEAHPMRPVSDAEMLRHLIEARGVTQLELSADVGIANSTISEVLSGKRVLTRNHIIALARYFHVSPLVFNFE